GILYVFRNVLAIPDPLVSPSSGSLAAQVETHDTLIGVLEDQLAADFFLTLISSSADQPRLKDLRPTLLDIVYYLFYRVPVSALFDQPHHTWFDGPEKNSKAHNKSSRHNNFGGVYAVSTGEGTIMPVFSTREVLRPFANLFKRRAKVDKPKDAADTLSVDLQWRIVDPSSIATLRRIAAVFIESCFNPFILALFEDLRMNGTVVDGFTPRLMYVSAYFVDISLANPAIDLGSTCALVQTHVFGQVMRCASAYVELKHWTGLEPAMYCLQQTLLSLSKMRGAKLDSLADNILSNLFYDGDALDLFVMLCRVYKPRKNTRAFLEQVARLTETFLDTLREYAQTKAGMVVRTKVRRRVPKTHSTMDADMDMDLGVEAEEMDDEDIGDESKLVTQVEEVLVEREFNISRYEAAFAVADVVKSYSHLLSPPSAIEHVFPMLRRIAITHQRPHLFFKKPIMQRLLTLFDDQLTYPNRSEMIDLAAWIFRQYMVVLDSPSLMAHYKAEPLDNRMAMECVMTFLKQSSAGKAVEPVITRNLIELRASTPETKPETKPENRPEEWDEEEEYLAHASSALPLGSTAASMAGAIAEINEDDLDFYGGHGDDFDFDFDSMLNN
ncbi:Topoisomerase 1-associated factor 1, partial [Kickxella alabastrina]